MPKFKAPAGVSGIGLQTGRSFACDDAGTIDLGDNATPEEIAAVLRAEFTAVPAEASAAPAKPTKSTADNG